MRKRPWLLPAVGFAGGILAAETSDGPSVCWAGLAVALFLLGRWRDWPVVSTLAGWGFAGWLAWWSEQTPLSPQDLRLAALAEPELVEVRGAVREMPTLRLYQHQGKPLVRTSVTVALESWRRSDGSWEPVSGQVMTTTRGAAPEELFSGQIVEISGVLRRPPGAMAPNLFDYREHLRHRGISYLLEVESFADWRRLADPPVARPWSARFLPWAQQALSRGLPDDESTRLLWAMTLGWRTALTDEVGATFVEAGTMHVFAISGLHIALLSGLLVALLRVARVSRAFCGLMVVPVGWLYVAATGWQPSAVRSAVMMTVVTGGWALRRPGDTLNSLALAALVILVFDPGELFQAGFQLSFAAVAGLALWIPMLGLRWGKLLEATREPLLLASLRPRWQGWTESLLHGLAQSLAISSAALAATLPFTIHYFHLLSLVSLVANVMVVPLSSLALAANLGTLATCEWFPGLAELFNASAWLWMSAMTGLSRWFAGLPGAVWAVASPSPHWWVAYYAFLLAPVFGWTSTSVARRCWLTASLAVVVAALAVGGWTSHTVDMTILPAGAIVVDGPGRRRDLVLNSGGSVNAGRVLEPFLRAAGWNALPSFWVTKADAAHAGGATNLFQHFHTGEVITGPRQQRSPVFRQLLDIAGKQKIPVHPIAAGMSVRDWVVLNPRPDDDFRTAGDNALALAVTLEGVRMVVLPELGSLAFERLLARPNAAWPKAEIVVTGTSEGGGSALRRWLDRLDPQLVIVTSDSRGRSADELRRQLSALRRPGRRVLGIEQAGSVTLRLWRGRAEVQAMEGTRLTIQARE